MPTAPMSVNDGTLLVAQSSSSSPLLSIGGDRVRTEAVLSQMGGLRAANDRYFAVQNDQEKFGIAGGSLAVLQGAEGGSKDAGRRLQVSAAQSGVDGNSGPKQGVAIWPHLTHSTSTNVHCHLICGAGIRLITWRLLRVSFGRDTSGPLMRRLPQLQLRAEQCCIARGQHAAKSIKNLYVHFKIAHWDYDSLKLASAVAVVLAPALQHAVPVHALEQNRVCAK